MNKTRPARFVSILTLVLPLAAGCGDSDADLAPVRGTVTLDGEPLQDATVEFELQAEPTTYGRTSGSSSYGRTDFRGRYKLKYNLENNGAMIGKHVVRITTRGETVDETGRETIVPERLPEKYHLNSQLTADVQPGSNTFDFPLEIAPPASGGN
jgi:hypothetical protein